MILNKVAGLYLLIETFFIVNSIATTKLHFYEIFQRFMQIKTEIKGSSLRTRLGCPPREEDLWERRKMRISDQTAPPPGK